MGLTTTDLKVITDAYNSNMNEVYAAVIKAGKFSWQQFNPGGTCASPMVEQASCATSLRKFCQANSGPQTNFIMYAFSPGGCGGDPADLPMFEQDLANFLLIRGKYAVLGHGWKGCSRKYNYPAALNAEYGEPTELCHETSSGVFERKWKKSKVQMDCKTWTASKKMM